MTTPNEHSFEISTVGNVSGETLKGKFTCKIRLSHIDRLRKDQLRREFLGTINPDGASSEALYVATAISELKVRLTKTPAWWTEAKDGLDLEDENVIIEVFTKAVEAEKNAREAVLKEAATAAEALRETKDTTK